MIRNKSFKRFGLVMIATIAISILISVNVSALPPSEIITCNGCSLLQESVDKFSTSIGKDSTITLIGSDGYQSYVWTGGGQTVSAQSFTVKVTGDAVYTLTLNGNRVKTVQVNLISTQQNCVFGVSQISIDGTIVGNSTTVAAGQTFTASVYVDKSQCSDDSGADFYWIGGPSLLIRNPHAASTEVVVIGKSNDGKNQELTAQSVNGYQTQKQIVLLNIISNMPPTIAGKYNFTAPLSHREFTVDCNQCSTGAGGINETGDYIASLSATVKDKQGAIVVTGSNSVNKGDSSKPVVTMTLGDECNCSIEVTATDSFGASTTIVDILPVVFGDTEEDAPQIKLAEPVECIGLQCAFDTHQTEGHGHSFSQRYYLKTVSGYELMYNINGTLCTSPVCVKAFLSAGSYAFEITMQYIRNGRPDGKMSEKYLTVCVGCGNNTPVSGSTSQASGMPHPAKPSRQSNRSVGMVPQPVFTPQPAVTVNCGKNGELCKTPGPGMTEAVFVLAALTLALRKKQIK